MRNMNLVTLVLIILGGLNWLSVGVLGYDIIGAVLGGSGHMAARIAYVIVGLSAVWQLMPMVSSFSMGEIDAERHLHHQ